MTAQQACEKWSERISAWLDGEAGLIDRLLVPMHLRECARCRAWVEAVTADEEAFRAAYFGEPEADEDFTDAVMARVEKQASGKERARASRKVPANRLIELLVVVGILAVLTAILFPVFAKSREKARVSSCNGNMKQIALALEMYARDYDGYLPLAYGWQDLVAPYIQNKQVFECPARTTPKPHYALSPYVAGRRIAEIADPDTTVMLYEVGQGGQPIFPHNDGANYGFVDGHVKSFSKRKPPESFQATGFIPPTQSYGIAEHLKIAYQASVEVVVRNLYQSVLEAEAAVRQYGGFLMNSTLDGNCGSASLTMRVPTGEVGNVINALGALGFVGARSSRRTSAPSAWRRWSRAWRRTSRASRRRRTSARSSARRRSFATRSGTSTPAPRWRRSPRHSPPSSPARSRRRSARRSATRRRRC